MRKFFIFAILVAIIPVLRAQNAAGMLVAVDSTEFLIGDQVTLSISGTQRFPSADQLSQNDIIALRQWFDTADDNHAVVQHTVLTCFDEGEHWLMIGPDDSLLLTVRDVPNVDTLSTEFRDIAGVMGAPYTFWEIFRWILLAIGVAAVVIAVIYVVRRLKRHEPIIVLPKAPPVPPHELALRSLETLRQRQLWQQGHVKEYHTELTDILRRYIYSVLGIQSTEMTTDQTLDAFAESYACTTDLASMLRSVLQRADMVKFAKSEPQSYEHDDSMSTAVEFVKMCQHFVDLHNIELEKERENKGKQ